MPTVHTAEPFRFEMVVKDKTTFAELLLLLTHVYDPTDKYNKQFDFLIEACAYFSRYRTKPYIIILCFTCKLFFDDIGRTPRFPDALTKYRRNSKEREFCAAAVGLQTVAEMLESKVYVETPWIRR